MWVNNSKINADVRIDHRRPKTSRTFTREQRLAWLKELLTGESETLPSRVAGTLLLYAQPLVRIAALKTTAIILTPQEMRISLGAEPIPVPEPFASMLRQHLHDRPNLRTTGGGATTPRLFPSTYPGKHLDSQYLMKRLRALGINLLGACSAAIRNLVADVPTPLVAELIGYSYQVAHHHAEVAAQPVVDDTSPSGCELPEGRA